MSERQRDPKREKEEKTRCTNYLLQMIEKYGAKVLDDSVDIKDGQEG